MTTTTSTKAERITKAAAAARRKDAAADEARRELFASILDATGELSVREMARLSELSPGRVHQIQHGK